jgi:kynurenine formamidase
VWLAEQGVALLGTDTWGTEPMPFADTSRTVHVELLVRRGVYLVENLDLELAAADGVTSGLFVCLPLKLTGATGSWVRPVLLA